MTKNLFSVPKLTKENNVVDEFDADPGLIKDKEMGTELLQGQLRDGLYKLAPVFSRSPSLLSSLFPVSHSSSITVSTIKYSLLFSQLCSGLQPSSTQLNSGLKPCNGCSFTASACHDQDQLVKFIFAANYFILQKELVIIVILGYEVI